MMLWNCQKLEKQVIDLRVFDKFMVVDKSRYYTSYLTCIVLQNKIFQNHQSR